MSYVEFKRIMDIFLSFFLLLFFLPIDLLAAIAIKFESPQGPYL